MEGLGWRLGVYSLASLHPHRFALTLYQLARGNLISNIVLRLSAAS
jgi:hypothetical protein